MNKKGNFQKNGFIKWSNFFDQSEILTEPFLGIGKLTSFFWKFQSLYSYYEYGEVTFILQLTIIKKLTKLLENPLSEVKVWLKMLEMPDDKMKCVGEDRDGQFFRNKTVDYSHVYSSNESEIFHFFIEKVSSLLRENNFLDCTQYFNYSSCCWLLYINIYIKYKITFCNSA